MRVFGNCIIYNKVEHGQENKKLSFFVSYYDSFRQTPGIKNENKRLRRK